MEKGVNLQIFELKEEIVKSVNKSVLPMEVKRMILSDITHQVSGVAEQVIQNEKKAFEEGEAHG